MGKPAILAVDDDPEVSAAAARDLYRRYSGAYHVVKRVASAIGEGGMSVYFVHRYLATI